ncbi:antibiotic biosynthesis monooxygenase family protein [Amycolatopsis sp. lyj-23]|uniref:antibiotic biosynthesis monooxygenase family protein n=1 Tax=Amycolatopsis sp. lyj-23 TaxID=2789283 RepID=UPI00397CE9E0
MVVFVNKLTLTGAPDELERIYRGVADFFRTQPGLVRFQLVRSTSDPGVYINIAEWEDEAAFRRAVSRDEFRKAVRVGRVSDGDPHLCEVVFTGSPA